jgi:hypothetical protein
MFTYCYFKSINFQIMRVIHKICTNSGVDPGFVVGGGGVWGPRPQRVQGRALVGGPGGEAPRKLWGFEELQTFI